MHNQVRLYGKLIEGSIEKGGDMIEVPGETWTLSVSSRTFVCNGCGTVVEEYAAGFADATGWTRQWQPRIVDSAGLKFCSEMCAHKHGERL